MGLRDWLFNKPSTLPPDEAPPTLAEPSVKLLPLGIGFDDDAPLTLDADFTLNLQDLDAMAGILVEKRVLPTITGPQILRYALLWSLVNQGRQQVVVDGLQVSLVRCQDELAAARAEIGVLLAATKALENQPARPKRGDHGMAKLPLSKRE